MATFAVSVAVLEQMFKFNEHDIKILSAVASGWNGTIEFEIAGPALPSGEVVAEFQRLEDGRVVLAGFRAVA